MPHIDLYVEHFLRTSKLAWVEYKVCADNITVNMVAIGQGCRDIL